MSIATTSLKYGWKVLAILTIGTGSIFVADNVLNRITTKDRIEVTLAIVERCLATQTGTNAAGEPVYAVDPPTFVRTWTDTNGASVIMTNAIAWRDDLSMKVELDAKIKALVPCYVDPATLQTLTVTGLWASLDIGDGTNQFTQTPAIGTNAATYGPWAWRNYVVAWGERYKVLYSLSDIYNPLTFTVSNSYVSAQQFNHFYGAVPWDTTKSFVDTNLVEGYSTEVNPYYAGLASFTKGLMCYSNYPPEDYSYSAGKAIWKNAVINFNVDSSWATNITVHWFVSFQSTTYWEANWPRFVPQEWVDCYDANGTPNANANEYYRWGTKEISSTGEYSMSKTVSTEATWCDKPTQETGYATYYSEAFLSVRGFKVLDWKLMYHAGPEFEYCVTKYW